MSEQRLCTFADLPTLAAPADDAPPDQPVERSRIQVAKLGTFKHPRYGTVKVTPDTFDSFQRNLAGFSQGEVPIDFDHEPETGGSTIARGWIKGLERDGTGLYANVEWTPSGAQAVANREFRYISPTWSMAYTDDQGNKLGPTLIGAALTNRPFFNGMAPVCLSETFSRDEFTIAEEVEYYRDISQGRRKELAAKGWALPDGSYPIETVADLKAAITLAQSGHGDVAAAKALIRRRARELGVEALIPHGFSIAGEDPSDSRGRTTMETFANIAKQLGLAEDATEDQVLTAARELAEKAEKAPADGQVLVASTDLAQLTADAAQGAAAAAQLAEMRFDTAWEKAVDAGKAAPAQRDTFHKLYGLDADAAIEAIEALQPIVNTASRGDSGRQGADDAPAGVDPDSHDLNQRVFAKLTEQQIAPATATLEQYKAALELVVAEEATG